MQSLDGQVAVITGGARGIGLGIAEVLLSDGASVAIVDSDGAAAEDAVTRFAANGRLAFAVEADVTDRSDVDRMAAQVIKRFGRIDILAANAGIYPLINLMDLTSEQWDLVMNVNVRGALFAIQACLPQMISQSYGRIVLTSSITGSVVGQPGYVHYGASKAAMLGLMRSAALEVASDGITINAILPGNIATPGFSELEPEYRASMLRAIPIGFFGQPYDVGWAVRFLASPEARYITGQTLIIDGGQVLPESS
jgi:3-oxoacyl-[acyl-carrier protein] reductase